jgi:pyridinium-3,5-bisthiocarboxylic acid mononucleotide nickel chelatase
MTDLRGLHLHFDAPTGAAGDMALGALFDLGVPVDVVKEALAPLAIGAYELTAEKATRGGIVGTDVRVHVRQHDDHEHHDHAHDDDGHDHHSHAHELGHPHRHYKEIRALVEAGTRGRVKELALAIFDKVAVAEAKLHGVSVDEVAFHEVGAVDSIVDTVGAAAAIAWLAPSGISAGPVAVGGGTVRAAHGRLPVPAPATLEICRAAGVPTYSGNVERELLTPTGAAILATVVERWGPMPPMTAVAIGYGAGDMELADRPNLLRAIVGQPAKTAGAHDDVVELAANLDDMSPELCEHVTERLFGAGALDVWWTPAVMKKSRPAFVLGVLVPAARAADATTLILAETTTLGVRSHPVARRILGRRTETVMTEHGEVVVKLGLDGDRVVNVAPEHDSCRAIARARGVPLKDVYAAAVAAFHVKNRTA